MSCSLAGDEHCALNCGSQAASKLAEAGIGDSVSLKAQGLGATPTVVVWETTQACDLRCAQCRINARPHRHPLELSTAEAFHLIEQVSRMKVPLFALTGGDPLKRADLLPIVQCASRNQLLTSLTISTTPLLVHQAIVDLKESGLNQVAINLDGSTPQLHDSFRGAPGSYKRAVEAIGWCQQAKLPLQVNTTVSRRNFGDLDAMIALLIEKGICLWNVFFLVPTGRGQMNDLLTADEHEEAFAKLYEASQRVDFQIKTSEGQHYARFVAQQQTKTAKVTNPLAHAQTGLFDGKGFVFISHTGEVYASAFLPIPAGNILWEPLSEIYHYSPVFRSIRDRSQLKGKCGRCNYKDECGGSRARAYAMSNDVNAEEPRCAYVPA